MCVHIYTHVQLRNAGGCTDRTDCLSQPAWCHGDFISMSTHDVCIHWIIYVVVQCCWRHRPSNTYIPIMHMWLYVFMDMWSCAMVLAMPWTLAADNQTTRQPTNQKASKATSQQASKTTNQHSNKPTPQQTKVYAPDLYAFNLLPRTCFVAL